MIEEKVKIRPILFALEVGKSTSFPIVRLKSVRTHASELGAIHGRVYVTKMNREAQTIDVTRTK